MGSQTKGQKAGATDGQNGNFGTRPSDQNPFAQMSGHHLGHGNHGFWFGRSVSYRATDVTNGDILSLV